MAKKQKTISKLKKELDKIFSLYIRLREATPEGLVQCFTCNKVSHYKSGIHAGHFISRSKLPTRFSEINVQNQCYRCNIHLSGNQWIFGSRLDAKYGEGTAMEMEGLSRQTIKFMRCDYEEMIKDYKERVKKLTIDS